MFTEKEINKYTPMMQSYMKIKNEHWDKLVFYRMGDFYELFFDDAEKASKAFDIKLTAKNKDGENPIPMAGIPFHAVDGYLVKAIKKGFCVVICEQFDTEDGEKLIERRVSKIVTPGTVLENGTLDSRDSKFLAAIYKRATKVDIAWVNFASGEIFCNRVPLANYVNELLKINPAEILISDKQFDGFNIPNNLYVTKVPEWEFEIVLANQNLINKFGHQYVQKFGLVDVNMANTIAVIMSYLKKTQCSEINHINNIKTVKNDEFLQIDNNSKKHLEISQSSNEHTLWSMIDHCSTSMGSRTLKEWLNNPIKNIDILKSRQEKIEFLKSENKPYAGWKTIASEWCDIERITTKIALKNVKPKELTSLRDTLRTMPKLSFWLDKMPPSLKGFFSTLNTIDPICKMLEKYLLEEPDNLVREGNVIANGIDKELDECRNLQNSNDDFIKKYENEEKIKYNIPNLKVEYNSAQGFYISISSSHLDKIPSSYKRKQSLKNAERFTTDVLRQYEEKALSAKERAISREKYLYDELLNKLANYIETLQKLSKLLAEWDVLSGLAELADVYNYVKPEFNNENKISMIEGRHPVLDILIKDFVPNTIELNRQTNVGIITGPNMGGKSTVMRQLALLIIMTHIGSFVPAKEFSICDIDAIFTRIGANDDIANGKSTFMVEMSESAYIINNATNKSLVLLDELGRGTATYDGLSLAWSITDYLSNRLKSFALFATHYLEMVKLPDFYPNIKNYHVSAIDQGNTIVFTHSIEDGAANKSYGLHVAELAGLKLEIIEKAKNKLQELEADNNSKIFNKIEVPVEVIVEKPIEVIKEVFIEKPVEIIKEVIVEKPVYINSSSSNLVQSESNYEKELLALNVFNMTPFQVMQWVSTQQEKVRNK